LVINGSGVVEEDHGAHTKLEGVSARSDEGWRRWATVRPSDTAARARVQGRGSRWTDWGAKQHHRGACGGDIWSVPWPEVAIPDEVTMAEGKWVAQCLLDGQLGNGSLESWRRF
jgi:hypothetical protein